MAKFAIVLIYDGTEPSRDALLSAVSALAEYGMFENPQEAKPIVMNEAELIGAIAAKAVSDFNTPIMPTKEDWAADVIFQNFRWALAESNIEELAISLSTRLTLEWYNNTDLVKAAKILRDPDAENHVSEEVKTRYNMSQKVFQTIRRTVELVCQGRHLIIR